MQYMYVITVKWTCENDTIGMDLQNFPDMDNVYLYSVNTGTYLYRIKGWKKNFIGYYIFQDNANINFYSNMTPWRIGNNQEY